LSAKQEIMQYTLIGSLGNITKPLASTLIAAGHGVTIVSSSQERAAAITALGATAAIGTIEDIPFLTKVFTGKDAIYTMIPPMPNPTNWKEEIHGIGKNFAAAIRASGVQKIVNLSSIGADLPEECGPVTGIHFAELELNALPNIDIKHLRPAYFYPNLFHSIGMIKHAGFYGNNFGGDTLLPLTHPNDIAAAAAEELTGLSFTGISIRYIVSDERTSRQIAAVLGAAIGKPELPYVEFKDEDALNGAIQAGLPEEIARNYTEMGVAVRTGKMASDFLKNPVVTGKTKLEDFAKEFAAVYAKA
jgi:uncharacterized protein YbjT (DUF2867 family)